MTHYNKNGTLPDLDNFLYKQRIIHLCLFCKE